MSNVTRCKKCGLPFAALTKNTKYCHKCKRQGITYYVKKKQEVKSCIICGKGFSTNISTKVYCSATCREAADPRKGEEVTLACKHCGEEFSTTNKNKKYCNSHCYKGHKNTEAKNARNEAKISQLP